MSRCIAALVLLAVSPLFAQDPQLKKRGETTQTPQVLDKDGLPPEEDKSIAVKEYAFNPLQAQKEIRTGNYYFKKGAFRAAAGRFEEATKWNERRAGGLAAPRRGRGEAEGPQGGIQGLLPSIWNWRATPRTPTRSARNWKS